MKRLIVDLDHTLCVTSPGGDQCLDPVEKYRAARPIKPVIEQLQNYHAQGFEIIISTSRNMRTFNGDLDAIKEHTLPVILEWLDAHGVPYDEVIIGKPWCGYHGFYIDDRAVRPSEFTSMSYDEILQLIAQEQAPS